ncbi:zeta toxin family protein [Microbacterium deminutum]|uniref:UDP-N-acetylglucosamine kinase n=1 Tax=Microbacterium deminutum TaxID=344164 RepID=A0ABN2R1U9_9MICO
MITEALSQTELEGVFERRIVPVVFSQPPSRKNPELVIVSGQPGSGTAAVAARLQSESPSGMATVNADDLRAFHPGFLELAASRSPDAASALAESAAEWIRLSLAHARTNGHPIVLDGSLTSPRAVLGLAELFKDHGFQSLVVITATPRSESLLSSMSRFLLDARSNTRSPLVDVARHDAALEGTRELAQALEESGGVDRLSVVTGRGDVIFEAAEGDSLTSAREAVLRGQSVSMSNAEAMRWLAELRAMTDLVVRAGRVSPAIGEVLLELHDAALQDVLPRITLPQDSQAGPATVESLGRQRDALRSVMAQKAPVIREDLAAPTIAPDSSGPSIGR